MTKKERMKSMIEGKSIDCLPSQLDFVPHRLNSLLEETHMSLDDYDAWSCNHFFYIYPLTESCNYSLGSKEDQKLIELAVNNGLIKPHEDDRFVYDNFHVKWLKNIDGIRDVINPLIYKNLKTFPWPDPDIPGLFDHTLKGLCKYSEKNYIVGLQHLILFERAWLLFGYENLMIELSADVKFVEQLMDKILEYQIGIAKNFVKLGVDAVRTGDDYGTQQSLQMDPKLWRRVIKPRLAKIWEIYRKADITVMHHSCGNIEEIIPDLIEIGLEILHPLQPLAMPIERLAKKFGRNIAFFGGIDTQKLLPFGKPQEILEAVEQCVKILGSKGRYIIAPSQEIMNDVPTENIIALVDGIKKYRKYL